MQVVLNGEPVCLAVTLRGEGQGTTAYTQKSGELVLSFCRVSLCLLGLGWRSALVVTALP